jgi:hypothetical protein
MLYCCILLYVMSVFMLLCMLKWNAFRNLKLMSFFIMLHAFICNGHRSISFFHGNGYNTIGIKSMVATPGMYGSVAEQQSFLVLKWA